MPLDYRIDSERGLITVSGSGTVTDGELVHCISRLRADPENRLSMPTLADLDTVTRLEITAAGINDMLAVLRATGNPDSRAKVAVLTAREADIFIARLIQALAEAEDMTLRFRAFAERAQAMAWLDI
jgi:hypothetical protein